MNYDITYRSYKLLKKPSGYIYRNGKKIFQSTKYRKITEPNELLKQEQKCIANFLSNKVRIHKCAFGFVHKKNIFNNAQRHISENSYIMNIDIKNFFDNINSKQVYQSLINNGMTESYVNHVINICTYNDSLPQGSPASPVLSNIVFKSIDKKIYELSKKNNCIYTRYADDITISGKYESLKNLKPLIQSLLDKNSFSINRWKFQINGKNRRQEVTGLVVNKFVNIPRHKQNEISLKLYNINKGIESGSIKNLNDLEKYYGPIRSLEGYISFMLQVDNKRNKFQQFNKKLIEIKKKLLTK